MRSSLVCPFYRIGFTEPIVYYFKRTDVAAPYMELYCQLSATDNIVLPRFHRRGCSDLRRARLRARYWYRDRSYESSLSHAKVGSKEERRKHVDRQLRLVRYLNRSQATNGSTLSIGYIHRENQRKTRLLYKYRREIIFGYLRQPRSDQLLRMTHFPGTIEWLVFGLLISITDSR